MKRQESLHQTTKLRGSMSLVALTSLCLHRRPLHLTPLRKSHSLSVVFLSDPRYRRHFLQMFSRSPSQQGLRIFKLSLPLLPGLFHAYVMVFAALTLCLIASTQPTPALSPVCDLRLYTPRQVTQPCSPLKVTRRISLAQRLLSFCLFQPAWSLSAPISWLTVSILLPGIPL